jgi:uncharacterized membrane protein YeaQ/YmgE (transglycosylase-associated protein family)
MIIYVFFGLIAGSVATWLMLNDTSLQRTAIAVAAGIAAGCIAGVLYAKFFFGLWALPDDALIGTAFGVIVAVVISRRNYGIRRDPGDLRGP